MMTYAEARRLAAYEEGVGNLLELVEEDGILVALIGKVLLALPATMEESLRPLIGKRIAILRTDLPKKEYLFRVLREGPNHEEGDGMGG
jgi:hypothetical protein